MGVATLKREAKRAIDMLSEDKVRVALDFIDYLNNKDELDATLEILASPELVSQIEAAERSKRSGRREDFIPWEKARRNVQTGPS